jgi:hypothetical protein
MVPLAIVSCAQTEKERLGYVRIADRGSLE